MVSFGEGDWTSLSRNVYTFPHLGASDAVFVVITLLLLRFVYSRLLYPKFFTPLRHIPIAHPSSKSIRKDEPPTLRGKIAQLQHCVETVRNNGLLRYYHPDGRERIIVTGTKALNEILVVNPTQFVKPRTIRRRLYTVAGNGLLLAEGEIHKVRSLILFYTLSSLLYQINFRF
jgi:hypothetical protein